MSRQGGVKPSDLSKRPEFIDLGQFKRQPFLTYDDLNEKFWNAQIEDPNFFKGELPDGTVDKLKTEVTIELMKKIKPDFDLLFKKQVIFEALIIHRICILYDFYDKTTKPASLNLEKIIQAEYRLQQLLNVFNLENISNQTDEFKSLKVFYDFVKSLPDENQHKQYYKFLFFKMIFEFQARKKGNTVFFKENKDEKKNLVSHLNELFKSYRITSELNVFGKLFTPEEAEKNIKNASEEFKRKCVRVLPSIIQYDAGHPWKDNIFLTDGTLIVDKVCNFLSGYTGPNESQKRFLNLIKKVFKEFDMKDLTRENLSSILFFYFFSNFFITKFARYDFLFSELVCQKFGFGKEMIVYWDKSSQNCKSTYTIINDFIEENLIGDSSFLKERGYHDILKEIYRTWQRRICLHFLTRQKLDILQEIQKVFEDEIPKASFVKFNKVWIERIQSKVNEAKFGEIFNGNILGRIGEVFDPKIGDTVEIEIESLTALQQVKNYFSFFNPSEDLWQLKNLVEGSPITFSCNAKKRGDKPPKLYQINAQILKIESPKLFVVFTGIEEQIAGVEIDQKYPHDYAYEIPSQELFIQYDQDTLVKERLLHLCASIEENLDEAQIQNQIKNFFKGRPTSSKFLPSVYKFDIFSGFYKKEILKGIYIADLKFWKSKNDKQITYTSVDDEFLKSLNPYKKNDRAKSFLALSKNIKNVKIPVDWANMWLNAFDKTDLETKIVFPGLEKEFKSELYEILPVQPTLFNLEFVFNPSAKKLNCAQVNSILLGEIDGTIKRPNPGETENDDLIVQKTKVDPGLLPTFQQVLEANKLTDDASLPANEKLYKIAYKILKARLEHEKEQEKNKTDLDYLSFSPEESESPETEGLGFFPFYENFSKKLKIINSEWKKHSSLDDSESGVVDSEKPKTPRISEKRPRESPGQGGPPAKRNPNAGGLSLESKFVILTQGSDGNVSEDSHLDDSSEDEEGSEGVDDKSEDEEGSEEEAEVDDKSEDEYSSEEEAEHKGVPSVFIKPFLLFEIMKSNGTLSGMMENEKVQNLKIMTKSEAEPKIYLYDIFYKDFFVGINSEDDFEYSENWSLFLEFFAHIDTRMRDFIDDYPVQAYNFFNIMNVLISSFGPEFFLTINIDDLFPPEIIPIANSGALLWTIMFFEFFEYGSKTPDFFNREIIISSNDELYEYKKQGDQDIEDFLEEANKILFYEANFINQLDLKFAKKDPSYMTQRTKLTFKDGTKNKLLFQKKRPEEFLEYQAFLNDIAEFVKDKKIKKYESQYFVNEDEIFAFRVETLEDLEKCSKPPPSTPSLKRQKTLRTKFDKLVLNFFEKVKAKEDEESLPNDDEEKRLIKGEGIQLPTNFISFEDSQESIWHLKDAFWHDCTPQKIQTFFKSKRKSNEIIQGYIDSGFEHTPLGEIISSEILYYLTRGPVEGAFQLLSYVENDDEFELHPHEGKEDETFEINGSQLTWDEEKQCYILPKKINGSSFTEEKLVGLGAIPQIGFYQTQEEWENSQMIEGNAGLTDTEIQLKKMETLNALIIKRLYEGKSFDDKETQKLQNTIVKIHKKLLLSNNFLFMLCNPVIKKFSGFVEEPKLRELILSRAFLVSKSFKDETLISNPASDSGVSKIEVLPFKNHDEFINARLVISAAIENVFEDDDSLNQDSLALIKKLKSFFSTFGVLFDEYDYTKTEFFGHDEFFKQRLTLAKKFHPHKGEIFIAISRILVFKRRFGLMKTLVESCEIKSTREDYEEETFGFGEETSPEGEQTFGFDPPIQQDVEPSKQVIIELQNEFYDSNDAKVLCKEINDLRKCTPHKLDPKVPEDEKFTPQTLDEKINSILRFFESSMKELTETIDVYSKFQQTKMIFVKKSLEDKFDATFSNQFDSKEMISVSILMVAKDFLGDYFDKTKFKTFTDSYTQTVVKMVEFQTQSDAYKAKLKSEYKKLAGREFNELDIDFDPQLTEQTDQSKKDQMLDTLKYNINDVHQNIFILQRQRLSETAFSLFEQENTDEFYKEALKLSLEDSTMLLQFLQTVNPEEFQRLSGSSEIEQNAKESAIIYSLLHENTLDAISFYRRKNKTELEKLYLELNIVDFWAIFKRLNLPLENLKGKEQYKDQLSAMFDFEYSTESMFVV